LAAALPDHRCSRVAAHAYPPKVHFVPRLPSTATGKIMRGVLRRQFSQETA
jgi:acetyl-CoA synthetase